MYSDVLPGKYELRTLRALAEIAGDDPTVVLASRALYAPTREERRVAHRRCNEIVAGGRYPDAAQGRRHLLARAAGVAEGSVIDLAQRLHLNRAKERST